MASKFDPSDRLTYDTSQIQAYIDTISLPQKHRRSPVFTDHKLARDIHHGLPLLAALQKHQLATVPFENLALHYNLVPGINLQAPFIHQKFIASACGRGGHCMEANLLFYTVLLSLGFDVTSVAARVNEAVQPQAGKRDWRGPRYDGWNHRMTHVRFPDSATTEDSNKIFLVDTGFGARSPNQPMELRRDSPTVIMNVVPNQESRVHWTTIPDVTSRNQKIWVYEVRYANDEDWVPAYCFTETEFLPQDYEMMNYFTSHHRRSWFTYAVVCVKMLLGKPSRTPGEEDNNEDVIIGDITLFNNELKKRVYGQVEVAEVFETETERVAALKKWFGVTLTDVDIAGIHGSSAMLL